MKIAKKKIISIFFLLSLFLIQNFILIKTGSATSLWDRQQGMGAEPGEVGEVFNESGGEPTDFRTMMIRVILILLSFLGIVYLILIMWAGYKWMISQGNSDEITEAKARLLSSTIGLAIILASYGIATFVLRSLEDVTGTMIE